MKTKKTIRMIITLIAIMPFVISCGGGSGGSSSKAPYTEDNPVSPDTSAPVLSSVTTKSSTAVNVLFSEQITSASAEAAAAFTVSSTTKSLRIKKTALGSDGVNCSIELSDPMTQGVKYTLTAQAISDVAGNKMTAGSFSFDGRGPVSAILSDVPAALVNTTSAQIKVSGTDIVSYQYSVNGGAWSAERSLSNAIALTGLKDGLTKLSVAGKDNLGNWQPYETPTKAQWMIDTIPPTAVLSQTPAGITNIPGCKIYVSGDSVSAYKYKINSENYSDTLNVSDAVEETGLADGETTIAVIAMDAAGNWQKESNATTARWIIDTKKPIASLGGLPSSPISDKSINVEVSGTEIVSYQYKIDSGAWSPFIESSVPISVHGLSDGTHTLSVLGKSSAGNIQDENSPSVWSWTIDTIAPNAHISAGPDKVTSDINPVFNISGVDVIRFRYKLDSGDWSGAQSSSEQLQISAADEGSHTLRVVGIDSAWNEESPASSAQYTWTTDTTSPSADLTDLPDTITNTINVSARVKGTGVTAYKFSIDASPWSQEILTDKILSLNNLSEGDHTLLVIARDEAGNWQEINTAASFAWRIDTTPPTPIITNLPVNPSNSITAEIAVDGNDLATYTYSLDRSQPTEINSGNPILLNSLSEGTHTIVIIGTDFAGNIQYPAFNYQWDVDLSAPSATLADLPSPINNLHRLTVTVIQGDTRTYKYSLGSDSWSSEMSAATPIEIESIAEGEHTLLVIGADNAGNWQNKNNATRFTWKADFTPPVATIDPVPDLFTNSSTQEITVHGTDVAGYTYSLDEEPYGRIFDVTEILSLGALHEGIHELRVAGIDTARNVQNPPVIVRWTVDYTPPIVIPIQDAGTLSTSTVIPFTFTAPIDASSAEIEIATDAYFSNVISSVNMSVTPQTSAEYLYNANESNGTRYYARVRCTDNAGNTGSWGTPSDGITLVGSIAGNAIDSFGASLAGVVVSVKNHPSLTATTDAAGRFTINDVECSGSLYEITLSNSGYNSASVSNISVRTGAVTDQGLIILVPASASSGTISGTVVSTNNGTRISDATVQILDFRNAVIENKATSNGNFSSSTLQPGTYSIHISKTGYLDLTVNNIAINGSKNLGNIAICEKLTGNHVRVVLLWGSAPKDLDLHVVGPSDNAVTKDGSPQTRFHSYWSQKSFDNSTGKYQGESGYTAYTSSLVQDSTNGSGPEAINTWNGYAIGTYTFTVHNYSKSNWYASQPVIRIYDSEGLVQEIALPAGAGSQWYWKAFQLNIQGSTRDTRSILVANQFGTLDYSSKAAMDWLPPQGGLAAYLLGIATGEHPVILILLLASLAAFTGLYLWNRRRMRINRSPSV